MKSRSWFACGASVASSSVTPQTMHITSSSMSGREVWGSADCAAASGGSASSATAASSAARRTHHAALDHRRDLLVQERLGRPARAAAARGCRRGRQGTISGTPVVFSPSFGVLAVAVVKLGVGEVELVDEAEPALAGLLGVDPEHLEVVVAVAAIEGLERRRLIATRPAPRGPDVDEHPLALVVGERAGLGFRAEHRQRVGRDLVADRQPRLALRDQAEDEQADDGEDAHEDGEGPRAHPPKRREPQSRSRLRRSAGVAQLVEHQLPKLGVAGSRPVSRFLHARAPIARGQVRGSETRNAPVGSPNRTR